MFHMEIGPKGTYKIKAPNGTVLDSGLTYAEALFKIDILNGQPQKIVV